MINVQSCEATFELPYSIVQLKHCLKNQYQLKHGCYSNSNYQVSIICVAYTRCCISVNSLLFGWLETKVGSDYLTIVCWSQQSITLRVHCFTLICDWLSYDEVTLTRYRMSISKPWNVMPLFNKLYSLILYLSRL